MAALQAAADRLSPQIIRQRLDYWTLLRGLKFSTRERAPMNLSRFYGLLERDGSRYAYRPPGGTPVPVLPQTPVRPLANSRFHHHPDPAHRPNSKLEAACHQADEAVQRIVDLLAAA